MSIVRVSSDECPNLPRCCLQTENFFADEVKSATSPGTFNTSMHNNGIQGFTLNRMHPLLSPSQHFLRLTSSDELCRLVHEGSGAVTEQHIELFQHNKRVATAEPTLVESVVDHTLLVAVILNDLHSTKLVLHWGFMRKIHADILLASVRWSCSEMVELLVNDSRICVNRGHPLREAVRLGRDSIVDILLSCPRVDVNASVPLLYACNRDGAPKAILRKLLEHPKVRLNRCTPGFGGTALNYAILHQNEESVRILLEQSGLNFNRGYFLTPLQLAVRCGNEAIVERLLEESDLKPDLCIAGTRAPLDMTIHSEDIILFRTFLRSEKVTIPDNVFDEIDERVLLDFQQAVVDSGRELVMGKRTRINTFILTVSLLFFVPQSICEHWLIYFYLAYANQIWYAVLTFLIPWGLGTCFQYIQEHHKRRRSSSSSYHAMNHVVCLYAIPLPIVDMFLIHQFFTHLFDYCDVYVRERSYRAFYRRMMLRNITQTIPQLILQFIICLLRSSNRGFVLKYWNDYHIVLHAEHLPSVMYTYVVFSFVSVSIAIFSYFRITISRRTKVMRRVS